MAKIVINQDKVTEMKKVLDICPFGAIELNDGKLEIGAGCKMCKICVKTGPKGVFEFVEDEVIKIDKDKWKGIAVYVDHHEGDIHPVTFELIGKAKEMAKKINQPVYCIFVGSNIEDKTDALLSYGVDNVFVYDYKDLKEFKIEPYTACVENFIKEVKPTILLFGGTTIGRSLAPRLAARFKTGLTADCTILDVQENTDLDQIRPAFGGNIMAHIHTPNHRPQFATVRYKIFSAPEKVDHPTGKVTLCNIDENKLKSDINVLEINNKTKEVGIEDAEVIIVGSRAIKKKEDMEMLYKLADLLGGQVAGTRPLVESGWIDAKKQIGLSGRTVKPKLIITCGVSGAIQFVAGMNGSECIISINKDEKAPIFDTAHYAIVGDVYDVIPRLIKDLELEKTNDYEVMDEVVATLE
ncbi:MULTISPECIES: electron transfer flavoprotein subunit alpha/FixB family protein [Paraclostridium]|uniref:electron transfer flavoprotein subunit alpha/FixB family protein n=1 Tax=Paraclostridium TaxID=1849822 RepID=UPI00038CB390|nr:electron transfer flavoprotein subunit alpha/FixB family protein [Paraclostridium bifermentans]MCU9807681.1 FAD-binding protein [Paraclostridium sp. AKS46]MDV8113774.1 FAD-binding protein [Bacillus sp. BAU-SS-2023]EQK39169.1 electron transfer flavoFAD-binding domain protein [[Clostridium] bifermentans ATCC 19299] [Paraclostridium bifermentans ATCC 19299]MCE9676604.1 FAD-binding protein [Paraclostridium bifermentans]TQO59110.1 electron transfer flavoprotein subunit alpha [Paraclostridium bif